MMNCTTAHAFVDSWEKGQAPEGSVAEFKAHLEQCQECAQQFSILLPLIERDTAALQEQDYTAGMRIAFGQDQFVDNVMAAIATRNPSIEPAPRAPVRRALTRQARVLRFSPALAAAAAAIFIIGLGLGLFFGTRNAGTVTVRFVLNAPDAQSVQLAGDFTSWNPEGYALKKIGAEGTWEITVPLKKGRVYVYNFVINGTTWIADPKVPAMVDDGFGGSSSLLRL
ncbi:MAG: hypothetical protein ACOYVH_07005 [Spirochaetota bacterium]